MTEAWPIDVSGSRPGQCDSHRCKHCSRYFPDDKHGCDCPYCGSVAACAAGGRCL